MSNQFCSCDDHAEGGITVDDAVCLAKRLRELGIDLVDCSSGGGVAWQKITVKEGYQVFLLGVFIVGFCV
jgi:2,4-dienoyl-CoA reductase-like NADH-dependent reductase (Old Yellow Enzyme family)